MRAVQRDSGYTLSVLSEQEQCWNESQALRMLTLYPINEVTANVICSFVPFSASRVVYMWAKTRGVYFQNNTLVFSINFINDVTLKLSWESD